MDFEKGAMKAFQAKFPDAEIKGCLFHLSQNVYKHVQSLGLQERYAQDAQFCLKVKHLTALGFVPTGDVFDGFELLADGNFLADAGGLLDYFEEYYIGRKRPTGERRVSLFPPRVWNVHERALRALPRTNNDAEGYGTGVSAQLSLATIQQYGNF